MAVARDRVVDGKALTGEELTRILGHFGRAPGSGEDLRVEHIGHGLVGDTNRVYLQPNGDGLSSVVVKTPSSDPQSRAFGFQRQLYQREVGFYSEIAQTAAMRVPRALHTEIDVEQQHFLLILEDLAPATPGDQLAGCTPDQAAVAMEQAAALHASRWGDPALRQIAWLNLTAATQAGLTRLTREKIRPFCGRFADRVAPDTLALCERFAEVIDRYFDQQDAPWTIQHADYRLDNVLWDAHAGADPMVVVDWQTMLLGPGMLDVAYFLGAGLQVVDRRAHERDLVGHYHAALRAHGVHGYSLEGAWRDYQRYSLAGLAHIIAPSMIVRETVRGDRMWITMLERHAAHAQDMNALDRLES
jgi:hypothetical protein